MNYVLDAVDFALVLLVMLMFARIVLNLVFAFAHEWHPKGFVAVLVEGVFLGTDWLILPLRKLIPPITLGPLRFDVAFLIAFFAIFALRIMVSVIRVSIAA